MYVKINLSMQLITLAGGRFEAHEYEKQKVRHRFFQTWAYGTIHFNDVASCKAIVCYNLFGGATLKGIWTDDTQITALNEPAEKILVHINTFLDRHKGQIRDRSLRHVLYSFIFSIVQSGAILSIGYSIFQYAQGDYTLARLFFVLTVCAILIPLCRIGALSASALADWYIE